ncbi:MAG: hypothetical protein J6B04_03460, partial [Clostridia bacterium]|nr:hypothetical protein [Clostridia bacterium]
MITDNFKVKNLGRIFKRSDVSADSVLKEDGLSVEYYHLLEKSALHVNLPEPIGMEALPTLHYL